MPGRVLLLFPISLSIWWFFLLRLGLVGVVYLHRVKFHAYRGGDFLAYLAVGGWFKLQSSFSPTVICFATLRIENEGVWHRLPLRYLRKTAMRNDGG